MKNQKNERGITLVALVVTIVVLLILAGITIMYVMQGDSIFNSANKAKTDTNDAVAEEAISTLVISDLQVQLYTGLGKDGTTTNVLKQNNVPDTVTDADAQNTAALDAVGTYVNTALKAAGMEDGTSFTCTEFNTTDGIVMNGTIKYKNKTYTVRVNTKNPASGETPVFVVK